MRSAMPDVPPTPNPFSPLPDETFYAEAGVALGVSPQALRKAVAAGVLSEYRVNGKPVNVWTRAELLERGVIKPATDKPPVVVVRPEPSPDSLVSPKGVCEMMGIARKTVFRWIDLEILPEPIRINSRVIRWRRRDIEAALTARQVGCRTPTGPELPPAPPAPWPCPSVSAPAASDAGGDPLPVMSGPAVLPRPSPADLAGLTLLANDRKGYGVAGDDLDDMLGEAAALLARRREREAGAAPAPRRRGRPADDESPDIGSGAPAGPASA